jgi:protein HOOK3
VRRTHVRWQDDATAEKEDAYAQLRALRREMDDRRNEKADVMLRAEIDRLRSDLQKSEDNLSTAEVDLDKQTNLVRELTRKVRPTNHGT